MSLSYTQSNGLHRNGRLWQAAASATLSGTKLCRKVKCNVCPERCPFHEKSRASLAN
ncbi:MAG: hypothetical protein ACI9G5_002612, partial [Paracoccaceae bacterium]